MTENIQEKEFGFSTITYFETVKFFVYFVISKIKLQHALFIAAFLAFGIGDGVTGAYMMDTLGPGVEANPAARYLFETDGFLGLIFAKAFYTLVILLLTYISQVRSKDSMYWTVNGFLIALTIFGSMAINANLSVIAGKIPQAPAEILFTYIALLIILTHMGDFMDRHTYYPVKEAIRS